MGTININRARATETWWDAARAASKAIDLRAAIVSPELSRALALFERLDASSKTSGNVAASHEEIQAFDAWASALPGWDARLFTYTEDD